MANGRIIELKTSKGITAQRSLSLHRKYRIPAIIPYSIPRPRLFKQLDEGLKYRMNFVTASAGFGKTTLVAQWLMDKNLPAVWISLQQNDNDSKKFWNLICTGFKTENSSGDQLDSESSINLLLKEISEVSQEYCLVLDDFHIIIDSAIHKELAAFISYLPENLHLIIISRWCLPPDLAGLKGKGYYKELNAEQLCFTKGEIASFFKLKGIELNGDEANKLKSFSEGWAAGLDVTAASLNQYKEDSNNFMNFINWNNEPLASYFREQITGALSSEFKEFLLQTSMLEELNGDLCDTITGRKDSKSILTQLCQKGLLLMTKDKQGYRCHHLFKLYLYSCLQQREDSQLTILHRVAGQWYLDKGIIAKAIRHFLQADDYGTAVSIVEQRGVQLLQNGDTETLLFFCSIIPTERIKGNPFIDILLAWAYALNYRMEEAEELVKRAEQVCLTEESKSVPVMEFHRRLKGEIILVRLKIYAYDLKKMYSLVHESIDYFNEGSLIVCRGMMFNNNRRLLLRVKNLYWPGRLNEIKSTITWAELLEKIGRGVLAGWIVTLNGEISYELNNFEEAGRQLLQGISSADKSGETGILIPGLLNLARIRWAEGEKGYAFELLMEAEKKAKKYNDLSWLPIIIAFRVRLYLQEGMVEPAIHWLENSHYTIYDELTLAKEYEYVTLARLLIALGKYKRVKFLLERLLILAEEEKVYLSIIELLNLMAIVEVKSGREEEALITLKKSLSLGQEDNLIRVFLDEGEPLLSLLEVFELREKDLGAADPKLTLFIKRIRSAAKPQEPMICEEIIYAEELSPREMEVLGLLNIGQSNNEIADTLNISIPTVKSHIKSIFRKLDVRNRTQAVARGRELKLFR